MRHLRMMRDNITESWLCLDCRDNTAPGVLDGPTTRRHFVAGKKIKNRAGPDTEMYMVRNALWLKAGNADGCLCVGCLEARLGRKLRPKDFSKDHPFNRKGFPATPRLRDRRGH